MTTKLSPQALVADRSQSFAWIVAGTYVCQGITQHFCLIAQPLNNFLKVALKLDPASASFCVALLMVPWVIKPIYGMLADSKKFALPGKSRRLFLIWSHLLAGLVYAILAFTLFLLPGALPHWILHVTIGLIALAGIGIAFITVVIVAMTVSRSEKGESSRQYFGQQALSYSLANMAAVAAGGALCARLAPANALACGLTVSAIILFLLPLYLWPFLKEDNVATRPDTNSLADSQAEENAVSSHVSSSVSLWPRLKALAGERPYLVTLLFLILWNLSPNLGVSLYFYECDKLKFTQAQIGLLSACTSAGTIVGALIFRYWLAEFFQQRRSTYLLVLLGVVSTVAYMLLSTPWSGALIEILHGLTFMVATLALYGLAADVSPPGLTATAMAIQIALLNLASEGVHCPGRIFVRSCFWQRSTATDCGIEPYYSFNSIFDSLFGSRQL